MKIANRLCGLLAAVMGLAIYSQPSLATIEGRDCSPPPTDMVIQYGDVMSGSNCNLPIGGSAQFRFNGAPGETIVIVASRASGGNVCMELIGPDGLHTPNGNLQCATFPSARIDETLQQAGTHTIRVSELNNDQALEYRVGLERIVPASPTATPITDAVISEEINPPADLDAYVFSCSAGSVISVTATRTGGGNVCAELYGPDGKHTPNGNLQCATFPSARIDETLQQAGTHTILVSELNNDQTLNYAVNLDFFTGDCVPVIPVCKGDFDRDGDVDNVDAFRFRQEFGRKNCPLP